MADQIKVIKLVRSKQFGFGFSILGGAGSELPPTVYQIVEGSPAYISKLSPGDIINEVNGEDVLSYTTKEVLNCLKLATSEVTLKLKKDVAIQTKIQKFYDSTVSTETLRNAITQDDLHGVNQIKAIKETSLTQSLKSLPQISNVGDKEISSCNPANDALAHQKTFDCDSNHLRMAQSETLLMTGELILNIQPPCWLPQQQVNDFRKSGSYSMPSSPNENNPTNKITKHGLESPCSPASLNNCSGNFGPFSFPPATSVRISKSEDHLQYQKDNMSSVNIELDDDVTSSLNTLLNTKDDCSPIPPHSNDAKIIGLLNSNPENAFNPCNILPLNDTLTCSPDNSLYSSHDSDSPLIFSQSPVSPQSPTSSMQYSCSGVYDKIPSVQDSIISDVPSDNINSNSSSLTSPDTDVPDELEWDDTIPTFIFTNKVNFSELETKCNNALETDTPLDFQTEKITKKTDENKIVLRVAGPERLPTKSKLQFTKDLSINSLEESSAGCGLSGDLDKTPTNTPPLTPGSGTLSPETLAYQQLWESEEEFTCLSEKSDEGNISSSKAVGASLKNISPPFSEDETEDIESLHSFHYSPKAVDLPSAVRLANRLYSLDGFKKSDVSRHLSKNNEFSKVVAEEYLNHFDFTNDTLDVALRKFLNKFCLSGETQDRERVLVHFSKKFLDCNPGTFNSQDAVHTLTCALMLLNTDLHGQNIGRKMTSAEFIENLADLNDGENFPRDALKSLYQAIHSEPLKWAIDDEDDAVTGNEKVTSVLQNELPLGSGTNPFLTPPSTNGVLYKKGYIMRKCCIDPNGKRTPFGKRSWKMWFCIIQDLSLYFHKDEQGARKGPQPQLGQNVVRLHHALAIKAHDYSKKAHVFRLFTSDQAQYLLQTSDSKELQAWIDAINFVSGSLSSPPLPGAVGSQQKFQRPLLPSSITKLNLFEQLEDHSKRLCQFENDLKEHKAHPPEKTSRSSIISNYKEKEIYLINEIKRYQIYATLLRSKLSSSGGPLTGFPGSGALEMTELPVFEASSCVGNSPQTSSSEIVSRVVPPPIPDRAHPTDRYSYQMAVQHSVIH